VGAALRGGRWRFFPLALPLHSHSHASFGKCRRQPAIPYEVQQPNSSQTAATLGRWPSFTPFASFPILCHVAGSAAAAEQRTPSSLGQSAPMGVILPGCRKTAEQLPCDTDHWLRDCAAGRITRGSRCGLVRSPFYPGPGLGVSISQRGVLWTWPMALGGCEAVSCQNCEQRHCRCHCHCGRSLTR
jgi:hypothetical protein